MIDWRRVGAPTHPDPGKLYVFHGTTAANAEAIAVEGFRSPDIAALVAQVSDEYGVDQDALWAAVGNQYVARRDGDGLVHFTNSVPTATGYARGHAHEALWELRAGAMLLVDPSMSRTEAHGAANHVDVGERVVMTFEFDRACIPSRWEIDWERRLHQKVELPEEVARNGHLVSVDVADFVVSTWQVAELLGVTSGQVWRMCESGKLPDQWAYHQWSHCALEGHELFSDVVFTAQGPVRTV